MISCKGLFTLYGRDTRATQWLNVIVSMVWLITSIGHINGVVTIALPSPIQNDLVSVGFFTGSVILFHTIGFLTYHRVHQVTKSFGLILGALYNAIIANGYVSAYPPLDMMLFVSVALSLWMFGAVFFIMRCEGLDGVNNQP